MKYKYRIGQRVTNKGTGSAVIINGVISSLSSGEEVNKFQPSKPGPYYYIKSDTGWIIGAPEDRLEVVDEK